MFKWRDGQQDAIHNTKIKREITSSFARALKVLQQKHLQFSQDEPIYSNDASNNLCNSLESAFLHGLKDSVAQKLTAIVGLAAVPDQLASMSFWRVVIKFTHSDVVTQLQNLTQINTEIGLCRAWVRLALNDGLMESYLHSMTVDTKMLKYFYHSYSYLRDHEQPGILKNYLTGLMSLEFKLSCNSSLLNSWSSSTLQLIGAFDIHFAPSPTVRHTERGHSGLDSVLQKNGKERDEKTDNPTVTSINTQTTSQVRDPRMIANIQNVEDLQQVAAIKSNVSSHVSLSVSEGSSSSHVSCPDPDIGAAAEARVSLLETRVVPPSQHSRSDVGNPSTDFSFLTFPDDHGHYEEQSQRNRDSQDIKKIQMYPSDESIEKSHIVVEEVAPPVYTASPTRPRSRRVGEDDIKYVFASSFSPSVSPGQASATHISIVPSDKNQQIMYESSSSPNRNFIINSEAPQEYLTSPVRSKGLNRLTGQNLNELDFQSVYQNMQQTQSSESDNESRAAVFDEMFSNVSPVELEQDVVLRKPHKHTVSQAYKEREKIVSQGHIKTSDSFGEISDNSMTPSSVNDMASERISELVTNSSTASLRGSGKSSPVSSNKIKPSVLDMADEETPSTQSRKRFKDNENEYYDDTGSSHAHHSRRRHDDSQAVDFPEVATSRVHMSDEQSEKDELSMSPSRFGNSLNSLSGWSSEIESKRERRKQSLREKYRGESFASMLRTYAPASSQQSTVVKLNEVIEALPCETEDGGLDEDQKSEEVSPARSSENIQREDSILENFEVLKSPSEFFCGQVEANSSRMFFLFHVPRELGLSHQNFSCKGCYRPIGIIYGQHRVCEFDGGLYCYDCHENSEAYIPSSILFDWDFRKKKVCKENYKFLQELEEQPLYNVEELNPKLYSHVSELQDLKLLRQQLCYLKSYLFTCSQKVAESLRQKVWPREHLYDRRDLYSITDFLQVQSGSLQRLIKDVVKFSSQHVYDCVLCSLKGFVCEICRNPQVIYPFEVDTTVRCKTCKSVYHKTCMTESLPCPKCERWGRHFSNIEDHPEDYGMSPHVK